ncbi:hypothetical protein [Simkania sp.]|uniref:hypothetical protein n=1 Tax=Simkania sp. TaxID=34094 RepID=UPI003B519D01
MVAEISEPGESAFQPFSTPEENASEMWNGREVRVADSSETNKFAMPKNLLSMFMRATLCRKAFLDLLRLQEDGIMKVFQRHQQSQSLLLFQMVMFA